jgi:dolichol-phosphate mannosyltransferase
VLLVTNGLTLVMIGLLGQYVGRISDEVKGRPLYVVAKLVGFGAESPSGRRSSE